MKNIIVVDDNQDMRFMLTSILRDEGFKVSEMETAEQLLKKIKNGDDVDLVLLDNQLPGINGLEALKKVKAINEDVIVIMLTAFGKVDGAVEAMKDGAYDYITKPFDNKELLLIINRAMERSMLGTEIKTLKKKLGESALTEEMLGKSSQVKDIIKQIGIVAPTNMTVVIEGESGTGKEVYSNLIHRKSSRADKAFVAIDCGAIPETLIESELFGHEKGAFTGADKAKQGKFEEANGGTLFLDEITNLSDSNQKTLLRVIQEKKLTRIGGKGVINFDVRIIAASNKPIPEAVNEGKFRADLYYRLNEFNIYLPPLRDRKEDITVILKNLLDEANRDLNKNIKGFSKDAMNNLLKYDWPGNVRELRNVVRKSALMEETDLIRNPIIPRLEIDLTGNNGKAHLDDLADMTLEQATDMIERKAIQKAIERSHGNKNKAAELLDVNRKTLYRKMKKLGLS
ncbi:MAG TPA: sigma-54 dependent transcriptional regulator [Ignavibacteria bacterium]|nr:sigma-54 dependent transcriptional regulator [Ignavibacteria bacterium]